MKLVLFEKQKECARPAFGQRDKNSKLVEFAAADWASAER